VNPLRPEVSAVEVIEEIRSLARPLNSVDDLDPLVDRVGAARYVCLGEASHGTHEYYRWRALLSHRLIEEHGFTWVGVEGDWPDCWRINRWVRGQDDQDLDVYGLLARFERWPTWMWANREVAEFLDWLHRHNLARLDAQRVGFYGLDVYSLWDSLREIISWHGVGGVAWLHRGMDVRHDPTRAQGGDRDTSPARSSDPMMTEANPALGERLVHDELLFDGSARLTLARFVTTWMEPEARQRTTNCVDRDMID
jgi:hypothetical protein